MVSYDGPRCHMTAVSYDAWRRHMTVVSYDGPRCHMTVVSAPPGGDSPSGPTGT